MAKRAERRHHSQRVKAKAYKTYRKSFWWYSNMSEEELNLFVCKTANNMAVCSRYCCGNPRRHYSGQGRFTKQEILSEVDMKEQILEHFGQND